MKNLQHIGNNTYVDIESFARCDNVSCTPICMKLIGGKNVITAGTDVDTVLTDEEVIQIVKDFLGETGVDPIVAAEICAYLGGLTAGVASLATKIVTANCDTITLQEILDLSCDKVEECVEASLAEIASGNGDGGLGSFSDAVEYVVNNFTDHIVIPDTAFSDPANPTLSELETYLDANHANSPETNSYSTTSGFVIRYVDGVASLDKSCCPSPSLEIPASSFADIANPTVAEVNTFIAANGPINAGTVLRNGGTIDNPDRARYFDGATTVGIEDPGLDTNYANTNLTSDANRTHTWNHNQTENFLNAGKTINVGSTGGQGAIDILQPGYALKAAFGPGGNAGSDFTDTRATIGANNGKIIMENDFIEMFNDGGIYKLGLDPSNPNTVPRDATTETLKNIVRDMATGDMILQDLPSAHVIDDAFLTSIGGTPGAPTSNDINAWEVNNGQQPEGTIFTYIGNGSPQEPDYVWIVDANGAATLVQEPGSAVSVSNDLGIGTGGDIEQGFPLTRETATNLNGFERRYEGASADTEILANGHIQVREKSDSHGTRIATVGIVADRDGPYYIRQAGTGNTAGFYFQTANDNNSDFQVDGNGNTWIGSENDGNQFIINPGSSPTGRDTILRVTSGGKDIELNSQVADRSGVVLNQLDGASPKLGLDVATPLGYENSTGHIVPLEIASGGKQYLGNLTGVSETVTTADFQSTTVTTNTLTWTNPLSVPARVWVDAKAFKRFSNVAGNGRIHMRGNKNIMLNGIGVDGRFYEYNSHKVSNRNYDDSRQISSLAITVPAGGSVNVNANMQLDTIQFENTITSVDVLFNILDVAVIRVPQY